MEESERVISDLGDAIVTLINQLISKGSHVKLNIENLSLDFRGVKVVLNGTVSLDISYISKT